jgi:hypothetical protein
VRSYRNVSSISRGFGISFDRCLVIKQSRSDKDFRGTVWRFSYGYESTNSTNCFCRSGLQSGSLANRIRCVPTVRKSLKRHRHQDDMIVAPSGVFAYLNSAIMATTTLITTTTITIRTAITPTQMKDFSLGLNNSFRSLAAILIPILTHTSMRILPKQPIAVFSDSDGLRSCSGSPTKRSSRSLGCALDQTTVSNS